MWNGTMFVDLDWQLNASSLLSASAELLVLSFYDGIEHCSDANKWFIHWFIYLYASLVLYAQLSDISLMHQLVSGKFCTWSSTYLADESFWFESYSPTDTYRRHTHPSTADAYSVSNEWYYYYCYYYYNICISSATSSFVSPSRYGLFFCSGLFTKPVD